MLTTPELRRFLRPAAAAARRIVAAVQAIVRPARAWDGRHHPVFRHFPPWEGESDGTFLVDFLGVRTDPRFRGHTPQPKGLVRTRVPSPWAGYFELVFVLESVLAAEEQFRMIEVGAGYGPWLVTAFKAMQATRRRPVHLIGIEMVPEHFAQMREHFRNNGLDPEEHRLIHAAVSDRPGEALFLPEHDPAEDFGQRLWRRPADRSGEWSSAERKKATSVRSIVLPDLLDEYDVVDLIHLDVQGEELRILRDSIETLSRKARRLIFATHSRHNHDALRSLLRSAGWQTVYDFRGRGRRRTPFGDARFVDGLQAYANPALCRPA